MKKLLFLAVILPTALSMCTIGKYNYVYTANYIYQNDTSWDLTVNSCIDFLLQRDSVFFIPQSGNFMLTFAFEANSIPGPFHWRGYPGYRDSTIVSNGAKQIIYHYRDKDKLYLKKSYMLIEEAKRRGTYQYTFTDEDFLDAEPI